MPFGTSVLSLAPILDFIVPVVTENDEVTIFIHDANRRTVSVFRLHDQLRAAAITTDQDIVQSITIHVHKL